MKLKWWREKGGWKRVKGKWDGGGRRVEGVG